MKTQLRRPARTKARYTEEYKREALELWRPSGRSAAKVAAELGIRPPLLTAGRSWNAEPTFPRASPSQVVASQNWKARSGACVLRTPNFYSSVKF
jgi:transposase-like protein